MSKRIKLLVGVGVVVLLLAAVAVTSAFARRDLPIRTASNAGMAWGPNWPRTSWPRHDGRHGGYGPGMMGGGRFGNPSAGITNTQPFGDYGGGMMGGMMALA